MKGYIRMYLKKLGSTVHLPTAICNSLRQSQFAHQFHDIFKEGSSITGHNLIFKT